MNQLIPTQNKGEDILVTGRDLHEFLKIGTQYTKWFDRMKDYGFVENIDFLTVSQKRLTADKIALFFLKTSVPRILAEQNIEEDNNDRLKRKSTQS